MAEKKKRTWVQDAAIYSALRRAFRSSPQIKEVKDAAKSNFFVKSKHGKDMRRVQFECVKCGNKYPEGKGRGKNIQVDHKEPVVDPKDGNLLPDGSRNWIKQINRLFVGKEGLQVMCKACHKEKSKAENALRKSKKTLVSK